MNGKTGNQPQREGAAKAITLKVAPIISTLVFAIVFSLGILPATAEAPSAGPSLSLKEASTGPASQGLAILEERIAVFRLRAHTWLKTLERDSAAARPLNLRASLDTLRRVYKRFELSAETLQPLVQEKFNGAPLKFLSHETVFKIEIDFPVGLQMLEEEVHEARPPMDSVRRRLAGLMGASDELASMLKHDPPDAARLWEAMENQVVQVLTLGLAGFDSPASGKGLVEAGASIEGLLDLVRLYKKDLAARDAVQLPGLERRLRDAAERLEKAEDFDGFDRLAFLREAGNPLLAAMVDARKAMGLARTGSLAGVTKADRAFPIPQRAIQSEARGLFDTNFLDPGFYALDYKGNPIRPPTQAGRDLGRLLFFDPILSGDNKRACASCHRPENGFAEPLRVSRGFGPGLARVPPSAGSALGNADSGSKPLTGTRNAPALHYAAFQRFQFWDMRAGLLEDQIGHVILGHQEFQTTFNALQTKLQGIPEYREAFARAFPAEGPQTVNQVTVTSALAQYMRSLSSFNSPFDRYARGESDTLDPGARRGFNLFMGKAACGTCHFPPVFNGTVPPLYRESESEVLGVPASDDTLKPRLDPDPGRHVLRPEETWERVRRKGHQGVVEVWRGAFKTPTVRNIELTAPYMHNGALPTLESVVRFYDAGGGAGMGLDVPNQTLPADSLGLSDAEREDLIAFMRSLTDHPPKGNRPDSLPAFPGRPQLDRRLVGGEY